MSTQTLRAAVFGAGAIGVAHIKGFQQHPRVRVVALAEINPERARAACDECQVPEAVADYRDLLKRRDIDMVSIALPNYLHVPVGVASLAAGKHVLMDKPFATHARGARRILREARRRRRLLMVGQNQRFTPMAQTLKPKSLAAKDAPAKKHAKP